jgi:O-methyltransferase involved in polyketide biosynthesis
MVARCNVQWPAWPCGQEQATGDAVTDEAEGAAAEPLPDIDTPDIDTTVPHSARIWNYWLGGTDNYPVDREAGDQYRQVYPQIADVARASRAFLVRAVQYLTDEGRIRQFLDVGAGLPAAENTHEVAQRMAPVSRIVYVDHDPPVVAHGRTLLNSTPEGVVSYVLGDLHNPEDILRTAASTLDFGQPVALMLMGVMGHLDDDDAYPIVRRLVAGLPPGSYLTLEDGVQTGPGFTQAQDEYDDTGAIPYRLRSPEQVSAFFDGLDLVEPGVVIVPRWRPGRGGAGPDVDACGGVARTAPRA